jgi:hypothetical protein
VTIRIIVLVALAMAGTAASASAPERTFSVTLKATLTERAVYDVRSQIGDDSPEGCRFVREGRASRTIILSSTRPAITTLTELKRWPNPTIGPLSGYETRTGTFRDGYEGACAGLPGHRAMRVDDTAGCGRRRLDVKRARFGYDDWPSRGFAVDVTSEGQPDPFKGRCLKSLFGTTYLPRALDAKPGPPVLVGGFTIPPRAWIQTSPRIYAEVAVDPARLTAGRVVVVRFKDRFDVKPSPMINCCTDPPRGSIVASSGEKSGSWEVRLVPVPG